MLSWTIDGLELTSRRVWQRYGTDITNNIEKDWVVGWIVSLWMEEEGVAVEEAVGEAGAGEGFREEEPQINIIINRTDAFTTIATAVANETMTNAAGREALLARREALIGKMANT